MQADWEFEAGGDAPVIDACWPGFVDLRRTPQRAGELPEAAQFPALAAALESLNGKASPVWTSKCDFWAALQTEDFDPDDLDASPGSLAHAMGCYIDLLPRGGLEWHTPHLAEAACRRLCSLLSPVPLRCCRADLIIRHAFITPERMTLGITGYLTACGGTEPEAQDALESALSAFAHVICTHSTLQ